MAKSPKILIDGYNLLFQSDLVGTGRSLGWLERARHRLLSMLEKYLPSADVPATQIVFDASQLSSPQSDFHSAHGILVSFANDHPEADDLLEELIRSHAHPKSLRVISSDHRIRRAARARKALSIDSDTFLDWMLEQRDAVPKDPHDAGSTPTETILDEEDVEYWMRQFVDQSKEEPN